jgi:hypothetical protein
MKKVVLISAVLALIAGIIISGCITPRLVAAGSPSFNQAACLFPCNPSISSVSISSPVAAIPITSITVLSLDGYFEIQKNILDATLEEPIILQSARSGESAGSLLLSISSSSLAILINKVVSDKLSHNIQAILNDLSWRCYERIARHFNSLEILTV